MKIPPEEESRSLLRRLTLLVGFIVLAIILTFCYFAAEFCIAIVVSALLAVLVDPIVDRLERAHMTRPTAAGMVVVCGVLICAGFAFAVYRRASAFIGQLPVYSQKIEHELSPMLKHVHSLGTSANLTPLLARDIGSVRTFLVVAAVTPFLVFFMLVRKEQMHFRMGELLEGYFDVGDFVHELSHVLTGVVYCYLVVGSGMAVISCGVFAAIGLNGAIGLGIIAGYANLIPYVGALIAIALPVAAALLQFSSVPPIIIIIVTVGGLHVFTANVIVPKWIGPRVNVGPAAVIAGLLFWGWLWGLAGVILAFPLTACLKVLADQHPSWSYFSDFLADNLHLPQRRSRDTSSEAIDTARKHR
jgi:predicted PurR-regulated permease PerM